MSDERRSEFARRLEFVGPAFPESETQRWHIWGCSPIDGPDGKVHLFCARWPLEEGHYQGWQTHSEIAHAVADSAEGPFRFLDVVLRGQGGDKWNAQAPHNPTIHKVGDWYRRRRAPRYQRGSDPQGGGREVGVRMGSPLGTGHLKTAELRLGEAGCCRA